MSGCWKRGWRLELPNPSVTFYCSGLSLACYDPRLTRACVCVCVFIRSGTVQRCLFACTPAASDLQTRRPVLRPVETCSHRQVMEPHQHGATGQTGPEGAGGVYYRKNTFLLVFCASATSASGKLKELQLDIWEVLILSPHCGSGDECGRWSKNDSKSQWIQQKWPQCPPASGW